MVKDIEGQPGLISSFNDDHMVIGTGSMSIAYPPSVKSAINLLCKLCTVGSASWSGILPRTITAMRTTKLQSKVGRLVFCCALSLIGSITIAAAGYTPSGASGSFTTADTPAKTVTVVNGVVTSIV